MFPLVFMMDSTQLCPMRLHMICLLGILGLTLGWSCNTATKTKDMKEEYLKNLACDIETGICAPTADKGMEEITLDAVKKVRLLYYTDPICSACWAIEPELRKFKLEYGHLMDIEYKMGGLLPGWEGFEDQSNGISKPSDVAHHWDEVGEYTKMSIDGDVWLEDPLDSSFPPSIAFKAVQQQGEDLALRFLRRIREQVFLEKKNITKTEVLIAALKDCNGNTEQFLEDYQNEKIEQQFQNEMQEGRELGVRGFPTFIFVNQGGKGIRISGMSGYDNYILALEEIMGEKINPKPIRYNIETLLDKYDYLATKEISFVLSLDEKEVLSQLENLVKNGKVKKEKQKYSDFWRWLDNGNI